MKMRCSSANRRACRSTSSLGCGPRCRRSPRSAGSSRRTACPRRSSTTTSMTAKSSSATATTAFWTGATAASRIRFTRWSSDLARWHISRASSPAAPRSSVCATSTSSRSAAPNSRRPSISRTGPARSRKRSPDTASSRRPMLGLARTTRCRCHTACSCSSPAVRSAAGTRRPAVSSVRGVVATDAAALLEAYDAQLRAHVPDRLPAGLRLERDGPLLRFIGEHRGFVGYRDLGGLEGPELNELIARQVRIFRERGESFEWKLHSHDRPADLAERLRAAGFVPEDEETVVIAPVAAVAADPSGPDGVTLREVHERAADPEGLIIVVAEAGDIVVCAGWVRFPDETEFATLWGGATLPDWRRRGIYRALVAYRARLAEQRGRRYLQVDAYEGSRLLVGLRVFAVMTTTPFVWSPPAER